MELLSNYDSSSSTQGSILGSSCGQGLIHFLSGFFLVAWPGVQWPWIAKEKWGSKLGERQPKWPKENLEASIRFASVSYSSSPWARKCSSSSCFLYNIPLKAGSEIYFSRLFGHPTTQFSHIPSSGIWFSECSSLVLSCLSLVYVFYSKDGTCNALFCTLHRFVGFYSHCVGRLLFSSWTDWEDHDHQYHYRRRQHYCRYDYQHN